MSKKSIYICQNCGAKHFKWEGRCAHCQQWNTLIEEIEKKEPTKLFRSLNIDSTLVALTKKITLPTHRYKTGINELDCVLGGGLVAGSYVLLGGPPGIGKSTLLLQMSGGLSQSGSVIYVCSEESTQQTALRAKRIHISQSNIFLFNESSIENILGKTKELKPTFLIIDSIQSVYLSELQSAPGTVSQVRECSNLLMHFAKSTSTCVLIIGHITKDGTLAGPKVLEHMVDAVLSFEGQAHYRILKASKNRFGATNELGIFQMSDQGLEEIQNPSEFFLEERGEDRIGSSIFTALEGQRPLLCEIQALTLSSFLTMPRRTVLGIDLNRLHMLLATLEKYFQIRFSKYDVFVNLVGGLKLTETAVDLAVATALLSSHHKKSLTMKSCFFGEIGLTGEVRSCPFGKERIQEAIKLGFQTVYLPEGNKKVEKSIHSKIKIIPIKNIQQLADIF